MKNTLSYYNLRIHGDNIIEAERSLKLIVEAFKAEIRIKPSPIYMPLYELTVNGAPIFSIELFPGHGRWGVDIQEILTKHGAPLREATDAIVTKLLNDSKEKILFAMEFCNALPAGNNAWQRTGRALTSVTVGIPYLYYADLGGVELGARREAKAPRFPNPIIPFAYLTTGKEYDSVCLPIYSASPSSSEEIKVRFTKVFGYEDGLLLIKNLIEDSSTKESEDRLLNKALMLIDILSENRKRNDTLRGSQWLKLLNLKTATDKASWLTAQNDPWTKKSADKVLITKTLASLITLVKSVGAVSVGANQTPLCLIQNSQRLPFAKSLDQLYKKIDNQEFLKWLSSNNLPLLVVWITGFKPRGDDSRPDRGLVPLARMLFGNEIDILCVVYGPGKKEMWRNLQRTPAKLASQNGLWETIINLGDGVLVDSRTADNNPICLKLQRKSAVYKKDVTFNKAIADTNFNFSEQDVDTALHVIFTSTNLDTVYESMCNPPGGDWSGLSIIDFHTQQQFRWTSLPRVSQSNGKRPDHVIQILVNEQKSTLLSIESKTKGSALEPTVGTRLNRYTKDLVETLPTINKPHNGQWSLVKKDIGFKAPTSFLSGGAFCWKDIAEMKDSLRHGNFDIVFGFQFDVIKGKTLLHILPTSRANSIVQIISDMCKQLDGRIIVQIH